MMKSNKQKCLIYFILALLIMLPYAGMIGLYGWYKNKLSDINNASFIVISKEDMRLHLIDYKGCEILNYPIACGKNYGNKEIKGDLKTPEGLFHITEIEKASSWVHDFGDGKGEIPGAYGPFFIRLEVPGQKGIGIHGTHKPESIGTRDTEGCIRLNNDDLLKLVKQTHVGMAVFITPSYMDVIKSGKVDSLRLVIKKHDESISGSKKPKATSTGKHPEQEKKITTSQIKLK